jgi:hypothetical protein
LHRYYLVQETYFQLYQIGCLDSKKRLLSKDNVAKKIRAAIN